MAVTSVGRPALPHRGVPAPPKNPPARRHSLSIAKSDAAHSHRGYKELSTGKPEPHHEHGHDELGDETESEVETEEKPQGLVRRLLTIHKDITLPFILLVCFTLSLNDNEPHRRLWRSPSGPLTSWPYLWFE